MLSWLININLVYDHLDNEDSLIILDFHLTP